MTVRTMIIVGATATAAAASTAVWVAVDPQNSPPVATQSAQRKPAAPGASTTMEDAVVVCVGMDQIVRAALPEGECPSGHREVRLEADGEVCELCPPFEEPPDADSSDNQALNELERRLRALENAPYFEVVNDKEEPVFRIGPDGVRIFNKNGEAVAAFGASQTGGYFTARSGTGSLEASMGAKDTTAGLQIIEDGLVRLTASGRESGGASLRIPSAGGVIAGIGASVDGPGTLLLGGLDGRVRASLTVPNGHGMLQLTQSAGGGVSLFEQGNGGGMFQIDDAKGNAAVKMGHINHRYGIVLAGPNLGLPLVPKSGLPGSYFMGCGSQAPPACVPVVR